MARHLTIGDLCAVTGYSRHQMRGLLDELSLFGAKEGEGRAPKCYTAHDLLVVAVCCRLETRYGIKRQVIVGLAPQLAQQLSGPRSVARSSRILILYEPLRVQYLEQASDLADGVVVALEPVFAQVDDYLIPGRLSHSSAQQQLELGPVALASKHASRVAKNDRVAQDKLQKKGGGQ